MANPSKDKGTRFETAVVDYLRGHGHPNAERRALHGVNDCGDVAGVLGWTLELKATQKIDLAGAMDEAEAERFNEKRGTKYCAAVIKRRQKPVGDAYVVMTLEQFAELIR